MNGICYIYNYNVTFQYISDTSHFISTSVNKYSLQYNNLQSVHQLSVSLS
jgi:hypothetical protein